MQNTDEIIHLNKKMGIYCLYKFDELVYIGISRNVYKRILEHHYNDVDFDKDNIFYYDGYEPFDGILEVAEAIAINYFEPEYNKHYIENIEGFKRVKGIKSDRDYEVLDTVVMDIIERIELHNSKLKCEPIVIDFVGEF